MTIEAGGWGCISATANLTAPIAAQRISVAAGRNAEELDRKLDDLRSEVTALGNVSAVKAVLANYLKDPDWARTIPPNVPIDDAAAAQLADRLDSIAGLRSYFSKAA